MEVGKLIERQTIVAAVFRAIVQGGAIAADGGGNQRLEPAMAMGRLRPEKSARLLSQTHAPDHEVRCLASIQSAAGKAVEVCLVAGARRDIGPGQEIIEMNLP